MTSFILYKSVTMTDLSYCYCYLNSGGLHLTVHKIEFAHSESWSRKISSDNLVQM